MCFWNYAVLPDIKQSKSRINDKFYADVDPFFCVAISSSLKKKKTIIKNTLFLFFIA